MAARDSIRLAGLAILAALVVVAFGAQRASATPGSFAPTGSMTTPRTGAAAAPLPNGGALVAGGIQQCFCGPYYSDLDSAEIFNAGRFSSTGSMSVDRVGPVAAPLLDGRVLVAGGYDSDRDLGGLGNVTTLQSAEIFDPATGSFAPTGSMTTPRTGAAAAPLPDGRVLVAGGSYFDRNATNSNVELRSGEIFDPATGSFTPTGSMSVARVQAAAAPLPGGRVLVAGGSNLAPRSAEIFDPATGSFSPTGNMTIGLGGPAAPLPDGRVLFSGEIFDPVSGTFARTGAIILGRFRPAAASLADGRVLIAGGDGLFDSGGYQLTGSLNSAELFTPGLSFQLRGRKLTAAVAVAGTLTVAGRRLKSTGTSGGPGQIAVKLKPTAKGKRRLNHKGKLKVRARLGFAPAPVRGECVTLTGPCYSSSGYAISDTATLMLRTKKRR
jgi:hypothetical protein